MFQNIPRSYIVRELDRANGNVSTAIDRLLLLVPDFMENDSSLDTSPVARSDLSTHYNILKNVKDDEEIVVDGVSDGVSDGGVVLTKKNWDSVDPKIRQRILTGKKKEMLIKAREAFFSQKKI